MHAHVNVAYVTNAYDLNDLGGVVIVSATPTHVFGCIIHT